MSPYILEDRSSDARPARNSNSDSFSVSKASFKDIRRLVDIEFEAFQKERTNHILSYRDHTKPAHRNRAILSYQSLMGRFDTSRRRINFVPVRRSDRRADPTIVRFRKVTDTNGHIISWAKTEIKTYTEEELASPPDCGHEGEKLMNREWFGLNEELRRTYMGTRRHCYIGMVATEPSHQHRGAGTKVLEASLEDVDQIGVECYLEATETARPLYERHGFVMVNEINFDPTHYGVYGFGIERQTIMVRGALIQGVRQEVRPWPVERTPSPNLAMLASGGMDI